MKPFVRKALICAAGLFAALPVLFSNEIPVTVEVVASTAARPVSQEDRLNSLASILAGLAPEDAAYESFTSIPCWAEHQSFFKTQWAELEREHVQPITQWRDVEMPAENELPKTLVYPFSGPDFLNAYLFFPRCDTYVFYSLELPGRLPRLGKLTDVQYAELLGDVQESLSDLFLRHYFITKSMQTELRTPYLKGDKSLFLIMMALTQNRVLTLEDIQLSDDGKIVPPTPAPKVKQGETAPPRPVTGVRITFQNKGRAAPQTLVYLAVDVSDNSLAKKPAFERYIKSLGNVSTMIKSASYLLFDPMFVKVRKLILDHTVFLLQDDSGLPYRYLEKGWRVRLFGRYTKPIKDFPNMSLQKNLDAAYKVPGAALPLPFKYGYHWHDGFANVQMAVKEPAK